jgi:hypothetical protein
MRPLNSAYANLYNRTMGRHGYLFQGRFRSILCQDQQYARELIRYINLNPLRAGLVKSLDELDNYPWCGHATLIRSTPAPDSIIDRMETLRRFGPTEQEALSAYRQFLVQGVNADALHSAGTLNQIATVEVDGSHKGWPAVIGGAGFAREAMVRHAIGRQRRHRQLDYPVVLHTLAQEVCTHFGIPAQAIFSRGRQNARSRARAHFCHLANTQELIPLCCIARFLNITIPSVNALIRSAQRTLGGDD